MTNVQVGDVVKTTNTEGVAIQVDTFITKAGLPTLRVMVETKDGDVKWVTIK